MLEYGAAKPIVNYHISSTVMPPKRPPQKQPRPDLSLADRRALAGRATYAGSPEHKDERWWGGLPMARQLPGGKVGRRRKRTTTLCPLTTEEERLQAVGWVRSAIANGQYRFFESDQDFPKKIWHRAAGKIWYGLICNPGKGEYKGWPIEDAEWREVFGTKGPAA